MTALHGVRVVELEAKGPAPFAVMLLADLGADVVRVDRARNPPLARATPAALDRGRKSVALNLKDAAGLELFLRLLDTADVLVEGYRPGVAERLGFGPDVCLQRNPRLVYARMTGWGQDGPLAPRAGHDINYLALTGALYSLGSADRPPPPPLNLVGDFGGGGLYLAIGILAALLERERSGLGQVVDAAMVDGASLLAQLMWTFRASGGWAPDRGANLIDSGAPFYDTYATADRRYVAVGAIEPAFYSELIGGLGLTDVPLPAQYDRAGWPVLRQRFTARFLTRTRDEWASVFRDTDACVTPVLSFDEALENEHIRARGTLTRSNGMDQVAPAPRFSSSSQAPLDVPPPLRRAKLDEILLSWQSPGT